MSLSLAKYSIGIPVFNEESILVENTLRLCSYLDSIDPEFELLIGVNGSTDRSVELARELSLRDPRIRVFEIADRKVGQIFQLFLREARSDALVSLDMDLSSDLDFVPHALNLLADCDVVVGSKRMGGQKRSIIRRFGSGLYIWSAQQLLKLGIDDYSMGSKAWRVSLLREFASDLGDATTYVVNALYLARAARAKIVEVPIRCEDLRQSRFNLAREAYDKYSHLVQLWWNRPRSAAARIATVEPLLARTTAPRG